MRPVSESLRGWIGMSEWAFFVMFDWWRNMNVRQNCNHARIIPLDARELMQRLFTKGTFRAPYNRDSASRGYHANEGKSFARNGWRMRVAELARRMFDGLNRSKEDRLNAQYGITMLPVKGGVEMRLPEAPLFDTDESSIRRGAFADARSRRAGIEAQHAADSDRRPHRQRGLARLITRRCRRRAPRRSRRR